MHVARKVEMSRRRAEAIENVLSRCRGSFLAVALFSLFINLLMLAAPLYVLQIFDRVLTSESQETLFFLTVIAAVAFVTLGLLEGVRAQVLVRLSGWIDRSLSGLVLRNSITSALSGQGEGSVQGLRDLSVCGNFLSGPAILPILDAPWSPVRGEPLGERVGALPARAVDSAPPFVWAMQLQPVIADRLDHAPELRQRQPPAVEPVGHRLEHVADQPGRLYLRDGRILKLRGHGRPERVEADAGPIDAPSLPSLSAARPVPRHRNHELTRSLRLCPNCSSGPATS